MCTFLNPQVTIFPGKGSGAVLGRKGAQLPSWRLVGLYLSLIHGSLILRPEPSPSHWQPILELPCGPRFLPSFFLPDWALQGWDLQVSLTTMSPAGLQSRPSTSTWVNKWLSPVHSEYQQCSALFLSPVFSLVRLISKPVIWHHLLLYLLIHRSLQVLPLISCDATSLSDCSHLGRSGPSAQTPSWLPTSAWLSLQSFSPRQPEWLF